MDNLHWLEDPDLRRPVLIQAFAGWNDASAVATTALRFLIDRWEAPKFADVDAENFYNFARVRPHVRLDDDQNRVIVWPENAFHFHLEPGLDRDFVLLIGIEPNLRWRTFGEMIIEVCQKIGVTSVLSLGGLVAQVPHTVPPRVTGTTSDPELATQFPELQVQRSRYQGPTGIVGVMSDMFAKAGIPTGSLWGNVPHYISASPNPKVAHGLLTRLNSIYGLGLDLSDMQRAGRRFERQINEALAQNPEVSEYVKKLEAGIELGDEDEEPSVEVDQTSEEDSGPVDLPAGEDIVRHLEEFLRQRREPDGGSGQDPRP
ncbi:MAG TPA: PAC2 family protein [Chloroflexota bacterium]